MNKFEKKEIDSCCGKKQIILKTNFSFKKEQIDQFTSAGFTLVKSYFNAGIFYIEDKGLIASCPFGGCELKLMCKNDLCKDSAALLEKILITLKV